MYPYNFEEKKKKKEGGGKKKRKQKKIKQTTRLYKYIFTPQKLSVIIVELFLLCLTFPNVNSLKYS